MIKTVENITWDFPKGDLFIDVGGNRGYWTMEMLGLFKKVIFIEPSATALNEAQARIKGHCEFFGVPQEADKIEYHKILCSSVAGEKHSIVSTTGDHGNFSIYAEDLYGTENIKLKENDIETTTLDSLLPSIEEGSKVMIKIDTEGCDLDIILGARELIKKYKPLIIAEMHWHMYYDQAKKDAVFYMLSSLGYICKIFPYEHYGENPTTIFDHKHNGAQMKNLHFHIVMDPANDIPIDATQFI